ncbi:MAG TPA: hypothetical protein VIG49_07530 [Acetobacteraceae bacterium]
MDVYTIAGFVGAAAIIVAYFSTQQGWIDATSRPCLLANLIGALLILLSLYAEWNFPAAVIEGFWAAISLYGLARAPSRARPH